MPIVLDGSFKTLGTPPQRGHRRDHSVPFLSERLIKVYAQIMSLAVAPAPLPIRRSNDWTDLALCKGKTELFFAPPRERPGRRRRREATARSYCLVCPAQVECAEVARQGRENGLWGAENDEQRAALGYPPLAIERRSVAAKLRGQVSQLDAALHARSGPSCET